MSKQKIIEFLNKSHLRIILPATLMLVFVIASIFMIIIPGIEQRLLHRKYKKLRELTQTAYSILQFYENLEKKSLLSPAKARESAKNVIRNLRYGPKMKNYFWVINLNHKTLVNPYKPELEERNTSDLADSHGFKFIQEFVNVAQEDGNGYVKYYWQWKDVPGRIEEKVSFVKLFRPWGWIIGTGLYTVDVRTEITDIKIKITVIMLVLILISGALSLYIMRYGITLEQKQDKMLIQLNRNEEKLRNLIETIPDMLLRVNRDGKVVDFKEGKDFIYFIDPDNFLHRNIEETWPQLIAADIMRHIGLTLTSGKPQVYNFNLLVNKKQCSYEARFAKSDKEEVLVIIRNIK